MDMAALSIWLVHSLWCCNRLLASTDKPFTGTFGVGSHHFSSCRWRESLGPPWLSFSAITMPRSTYQNSVSVYLSSESCYWTSTKSNEKLTKWQNKFQHLWDCWNRRKLQNFQGYQTMANKFLGHSDSCEVLDLKIATRFLCKYNNKETCLHTPHSSQVAECCYSIEKKRTDRWVILYH